MAIAKRIFLFLTVNILILLTLSITLQVLGVRPYLTRAGIDYEALMGFCLVWGMGGAFISLGLSRVMAKWMLGVAVIDPDRPGEHAELLALVERLAAHAGLPRTPEVGVYDSPELNAFATGPTKSRALVAVSTGLLARMRPAEVEGVLGHEISHIANGDMVTMTLIQGVVNALVMFLARAIAFAASQNVKEDNRYMVRFLVTIVLEIALSLLGMMVVAWFSRWREYRADSGGAALAGRDKMVGALRALERGLAGVGVEDHAALKTLKISGKGSRWLMFMSTHPPLADRIARLEAGA